MNMQYARMVLAHEQAHRDRVNAQSPNPHRASRHVGPHRRSTPGSVISPVTSKPNRR
jgi:hypothetical protein